MNETPDDQKCRQSQPSYPIPAYSAVTKTMPFSNDAERGILSCFYYEPTQLVQDAKNSIPPEAFYHPANRLLYETFLLFHEDERPIEYIAISNYLQDKGLMDKVGGQGALAELLDFVPTPTHYGYYKGILKDKYLLRRGIGICTEHIQRAYEYQEGGLDEWTKKMAEDCLALRQYFLMGNTIREGQGIPQVHDKMIDDLYRKGPSTGFPWFDKIFGGLLETSLMLFQGRRAIGKSSIARQIAWHAAKAGIPTDVFTVEMSKVQYYHGLCCLEGVDSTSFLQKTFAKHELEIMEKMRSECAHTPLRLHEDATHVDEVVNRMQIAKSKRDTRLFVVDMPQRLTGDKKNGREQELSGIFWELKNAAKALNATVLAPVHMNAQLIARGSEDIENHADQIVIMAASKDEPTPMDRWSKKVLIKCTKNRYGPDGGRCLFHLIGKHMQFEEVEENMELDIEPAKESRPARR